MTEEQRKLFEDTFLSSVLDRMGTHIYITDLETDEILYMNENMKHAFGLEDPEGEACWQALQRGISRRCEFCPIDRLVEKKSEKGWVWQEGNTLIGRVYHSYDSLIKWNGRAYHIQNSIDVMEYDKVLNSTRTDELTQMLNRHGGSERLTQAIEQAAWENQTLTLVLYDINKLKQVNDKYGYSAGDSLLRYVASITRECLGRMDSMFRLSGDEFVMLSYGRSRAEVEESMKRILQRARQNRERVGIDYGVPFSYGMTEIYSGDNNSTDDIIARADGQMYIQKRAYHIIWAKKELSENGQSTSADLFKYDNETFCNALTSSTEDYILVGNMKTGMFRYPQAVVEGFGLPSQVVMNVAAFWGGLIHPHDEAYLLESNRNIADDRRDYHNIEYEVRNVEGEWIWLRCRGKMVRDEERRPELFAGMISNLGRRNQIDHMTGLYNRYEFEGDIKKYLVDHKEVDMIGFMILGLDLFKNINNLYDRSFGDKILRITAQKVSSMFPTDAKLYRLDGDEFGVLCLGSNEEDGQDIFHKIQQNFHKQQEYNGREYYCTCSAGFTIYPRDGDNYLELLKRANYSLGHSKLTGRNRMTVFSKDILAGRERRLGLLELFKESIEQGFAGFTIHYQPQVDTRTDVLQGAEALAKWYCSKCGDISPREFIPLLEQNGLITQLGRWIFYHAAAQCREQCGFKPDFRMSISLSYIQLTEGGTTSYIGDTLKEFDLEASHVVMKLTETYLTKADDCVLQMLGDMKAIGIQVAVDDFGVGYSSLFPLENIPVDIVKIDRGFVKRVTTDIFNTAFIRSITALCHDVGKQVCLEGVETEEEYLAVRGLGTESIQGFYFRRSTGPVESEQKYGLNI